ncbi:MAG: dltC [Bacillales bacterium]|jgi:D-alanine--poly(phosphoribitol) ligase subunit 2|nr:dltC [Bacillales bacterium]
MDFKQEVLELLAEICKEDVVKEDTNIDLFENGLLDSFGIVEFLVKVEEKFNITVPITEVDRETWNTPNNIANQLEDFR